MADMTLEGLAFACEVSYTGLLSVLFAQRWTFALNTFSLTFGFYPVKSSSSFRSQASSPLPQKSLLKSLSHIKSSVICFPGTMLYLYPVYQFYFYINLYGYLMRAETPSFLHNKAKEGIWWKVGAQEIFVQWRNKYIYSQISGLSANLLS